MAISANTAWEVRPTNGNDANGGGFVAGATGTDWSQQNFPQYSVNDGVANGTTTITSASATFGTDVPGNLIYVQGGTGTITAGWYQIVSRTNSTTIVVDRSTGLTAGTGVTLHIGGALKTLAQSAAIYAASNKIFAKGEAIQTTTAGVTFSTGATPSATAPMTRIIGYTSVRGDGGQFTLKLLTNAGLIGIQPSGAGISLENITVDCNSLGTSEGFGAGNFGRLVNCIVKNFTLVGINTGSTQFLVHGCEVTGGTSAASEAVLLQAAETYMQFCNIHDNACTGVKISGTGPSVRHCLIANNTGASSDGIQVSAGNSLVIEGNTIYGSGRDGIRWAVANTPIIATVVNDNILASNGGWGMNSTTAAFAADPVWDGNVYYNNTSGTRNNMDDTGGTNAINGVSPYTNTLDIVITNGSPFTNAAGGDFTLNNTTLRGALIRGHGVPATLPNATGTSYPDMGVFQHQDPASGGINRAAYPSGVSSVG